MPQIVNFEEETGLDEEARAYLELNPDAAKVARALAEETRAVFGHAVKLRVHIAKDAQSGEPRPQLLVDAGLALGTMFALLDSVHARMAARQGLPDAQVALLPDGMGA